MSDLLIIAHGRLQRGGAGRRFAAALRRLGEIFGSGVEVRFTAAAGDATRLSRAALHEGAGWIAAAGGDGMIHEVANGFFDHDHNLQPKSSLSFLPCGTANDWVKSLELPASLEGSVELLARSNVRQVDVGLARFQGLQGATEERVFINVAEAGLGARVVERVSRELRYFGPRAAYAIGIVTTFLAYRPRRMQLVLDGETALATGPLVSMIVAGGQYFGAGIRCAPMARPDDGLLEVLTLGDFGLMEMCLKLGKFTRGEHLGETKVRHYRIRALECSAGQPVWLVLDGELVGRLPVMIRVLPGALRIRC